MNPDVSHSPSTPATSTTSRVTNPEANTPTSSHNASSLTAAERTRVAEALVTWFAREGRDLPWRKEGTSPWAILVCEVMSQQTPVARVLPRWKEWMTMWPTPAALAGASPHEVLVAWGNLGYPRRGLRLAECARKVTDTYGGVLPRTREELLALPGVGEYTADAVLAFAYRSRTTVLDTNIRRVIARIEGEGAPRPHLTRGERERASQYVPADPETSARYNAAVMELGALVCTAATPDCAHCPVLEACRWFAAGKPEPAHRPRTQKFEGTIRQARGTIMACLRGELRPWPVDELRTTCALGDRFAPALAGLLADGLATEHESGITLPGLTP